MMLMFMRPGMSRSSGGFIYIALGVMVIASAGMMLGQVMRRNGERKQRMKGERRDYLRYLRQTRRIVRTSIVEQQRALAWRHPEPDALSSLVRSTRLWERRSSDEDFGEVRMGVGDQRLAMKLTPLSTKPVEDLEPLSAHALRSFTRAYSTVRDQPIAIYLRAWSKVLFRGDEERIRAQVRACSRSWRCSTPPTTCGSRCVCRTSGAPSGSGRSGCRTVCTGTRRTAPVRPA